MIICYQAQSFDDIVDCEEFDGTSTTQIFSTNLVHNNGGLGFYEGNPTIVAGWGEPKIETLTSSGWVELFDFEYEIIFNLFLYTG